MEKLKGWKMEKFKNWKIEEWKGWKMEKFKNWKIEELKGWRMEGWKICPHGDFNFSILQFFNSTSEGRDADALSFQVPAPFPIP